MKTANESSVSGRLGEHPGYPVLYMFLVTFLFSAVLIGLSAFTREEVEANRQILFEKAVLTAVGVDVKTASRSEIHQRFQERIEAPTPASGGIYRSGGKGTPVVFAVRFEGQGFWDTIKGVIGVRADRRTLTGIAFYQQKETPGLGAEIVKDSFTKQFAGLVLGDGSSAFRIRPAGRESAEGEIHGVTGATQTCKRLEDIINRTVTTWRQDVRRAAGEHEP